jgi:hypothetical protein
MRAAPAFAAKRRRARISSRRKRLLTSPSHAVCKFFLEPVCIDY